ncbi:protein complex oligomerization [Polyrhizophydium stewartii]|uniref:Protein complex oligomerization n=1 Tax=Polyrhizophydium stewartii TaxID=2732419 RepID=A0ABR4N9A6_9FUNG
MSHIQDIPAVLRSDWELRDFVRTLSRGVLDLTAFLQRFEQHARSRIATLDERLERIERSLATYEARVSCFDAPAQYAQSEASLADI